MSPSLTPSLILSLRKRNCELPLRDDFRTTIERLKGNVQCENQEIHQALRLLLASTITARAEIVYRHLACYHLWRIDNSDKSRGPLISAFAQHSEVSDTTMKFQIRSKGPLISDILEMLELNEEIQPTVVLGTKTPWAVVIVIVMLIQPMIKATADRRAISNTVRDLLQDYKDEDWQHPSLASDSVRDVIQCACGFHFEPRPRGRQSRVITPPPEGGLHKFNLVGSSSRSQEVSRQKFE